MANIITLSRILIGIALAFSKPFSLIFLMLYCCGGISDMIDGTVARRTGSANEFGSKLDTAADLIFFICCIVKLVPYLDYSIGVWIWIAIVALLKIGCVIFGYIKNRKIKANHTVMNKITGVLLFMYPLTLLKINSKYIDLVLCSVATIAAVQEWYLTVREKKSGI